MHLALTFAKQPDNEVVFISTEEGLEVPGLRTIQIQPTRASAHPTHHYVQSLENAVLLGQAAYRACIGLRDEGFVPDLIYAHAGFGPGLYVKDVFPDTPVIGHFEWFYSPTDSDVDFLSAEDVSEDEALRIRTKNAGLLLELTQCDQGICPTSFQLDQFPEAFHSKLHVIHEGIDTTYFTPAVRGQLSLDELQLDGNVEIVTYATRGMEPYRGFPQFMRALETLQSLRPRLHAVIVGADAVNYGRPRDDGKSWKDAMLEELPDLDLSRVHFTGSLPIESYRQVLQASHAHVYLTVPFVLSWSLLEAMSTGCSVVGSATAPVCEIVRDEETGYLADFFDSFRLAARIAEVLDDQPRARAIGQAARDYMVAHYDLAAILPCHVRLATHVLGEEMPVHPLAWTQPNVAKSA